jgi:hypothetical protein
LPLSLYIQYIGYPDPEEVAEEGIEAFEDLENRVEKQVIT